MPCSSTLSGIYPEPPKLGTQIAPYLLLEPVGGKNMIRIGRSGLETLRAGRFEGSQSFRASIDYFGVSHLNRSWIFTRRGLFGVKMRDVLSSFCVAILILLFTTPQVRANEHTQFCGPGDPCDACSQDTVQNLFDDLFKDLNDKIADFFRLDNLVELAAKQGAKATVDKMIDKLEDPQQKQNLQENRAAVEQALAGAVEALLRGVLGEGVRMVGPSVLGVPLPLDPDPVDVPSPDLSQFSVDGISPIIEYEFPKLDEAGEFVDDVVDGDFDPILARFKRLGTTVNGSAGNGWAWALGGGVENPFDDDKLFATLEFGYDRGGNGIRLEADLVEGGEWDVALRGSFSFSECECCARQRVNDNLKLVALDVSPHHTLAGEIFGVTATLENVGQDTLRDTCFVVAELGFVDKKLTGQNTLANATSGKGGVGSKLCLTGDVSQRQRLSATFDILLARHAPFNFFVDAFAVIIPPIIP